MLPFPGEEQAVTGHSVNRGPRRRRLQPAAGRFVGDPAGTPRAITALNQLGYTVTLTPIEGAA
jgi:hypothetical protein